MSIDLYAIEALLSTFGPPSRRAAATIPLDDACALVAEVRRLSGVVSDLLYLADLNEKTGDPIWPYEIRSVMNADDLCGTNGCLRCEVCS